MAKSDLSELITDDSDDTSLSSIEVIEKKLPEWNQTIPKFMDSIAQKPGINAKAFVILDTTTAQDKSTCFVATDAREDKYGAWPYLGFRCDLSSLVPALEALDHASVRDLRNQAAISSGAWRKEVLDASKKEPSRIKPSDYPIHQGWSTELVPANNDTSKPYFPVFRTADVPLEVCDPLSSWHR